MFIDQEKTEQLSAFLEGEHFRYRRDPSAVPAQDEVDFSSAVSIEISAPKSPLVLQMEKDFRSFLTCCVGVDFADSGEVDRGIIFSLDGSSGNRTAGDGSYSVDVTEDRILVRALGERGLLHGAHHIERCFSLRQAPFIRGGTTVRSPVFTPRISQTVFTAGDGNIENPKMLTDDYMSLMSHFGINGVHIYARLWDYCLNTSLPELNTPNYEENVARLRSLCERAAVYGIDIYLVVRTEYFPEDAAVFAAHPEVRGAACNFEQLPAPAYSLCSSAPKVLACYREAFSNLFSSLPMLGGALLLVGGEGFFHCFTRPKPPLSGGTSCPNCSGRDPSEVVAGMVNTVGGAVKSASPDAKIFAWPYSAFTWLGDALGADAKFIRSLDSSISLLSNFDNPHPYRLGDQTAMLLDYNIVNVGPSELFRSQTEVLREKGLPHYAKYEATIEPGWFFLPYLPIHYRWAERTDSMRRHNVEGYVCQWRFYGVTGSLPEEILAEMSWDENANIDDILLRIARRDFGSVSESILDGWRILSDTWPKIPSSHMLFGEREFYMKGPLYLGPAHPLVFDAQNRYGLGGKFFTLRGDIAEMVSAEEMEELEKNAPPRYSSDLLLTYPFGAQAVEDAFTSALADWNAGVTIIDEAIGGFPNQRAVMELDICRIIGIHLRSIRNVVRFYRLRDAFFASPGTRESIAVTAANLTVVLNDEIENAESAVPILERDFRIGYGHSYGQVYDAGMVTEKIRQCRYVRDAELPELISGIKFHVYMDYSP